MSQIWEGAFNKSSPTKEVDKIKQVEAFYFKGKQKTPECPSLNNKAKHVKHNPLNKHGQISRCVVCDSKMNWTDKCPHKNEKGFSRA